MYIDVMERFNASSLISILILNFIFFFSFFLNMYLSTPTINIQLIHIGTAKSHDWRLRRRRIFADWRYHKLYTMWTKSWTAQWVLYNKATSPDMCKICFSVYLRNAVGPRSFGSSTIGKSSTVYDFVFFLREYVVIFMFSTRAREWLRVRSIFM